MSANSTWPLIGCHIKPRRVPVAFLTKPITAGTNEMPTAKPRRKRMLPNVERHKDRHNKIRYYYRVGKGPRTPISGALDSPEFMASYMAIANGLTGEPVIKRRE